MAALALTGCGDGKSPTASSGSDQDLAQQEGAPGEPRADDLGPTVQDLVARLAQLGAAATYEGQSLESSFFVPAAHLVHVNGAEVRVYAYDSAEALKADAQRISPDGGTLGETSVRWIEAPHFYARGTFLALYVGADDGVLGVLGRAFGRPFAGQGAEPRVVDGPIPCDVDGRAERTDPALIAAGSQRELADLSPYLGADRAAQLSAVDLSANWVVAVFRGQMPTAGYGVDIEGVAVDESGGTVVVTVSLANPPIDALVAQVITYPLDVEVVPREGLPASDEAAWVALDTDGKPLARYAGGVSSPGNGGIVGPDPGATPARFDLSGRITLVEAAGDDPRGILSRILVEGEAGQAGYDKAWLDILQATELSFDGETFAPPTLDDLAPGRRVQVVFTGPVRKSYPAQAVARTVVIYR